MTISKSLHVITGLMEILFPSMGFLVTVHPKAGTPGKSAMITNLQDADVLAMMREYIQKHEKGTIHVNDHRKSLKN